MSTLLRKAGFSIYRQINMRTNVKLLHVTAAVRGAHDKEFEAAKQRLGTLKSDPGNQTKLQIYGLFKQATKGKNTTPKPGMMDFVGKAKWEAWNSLGDMSSDDAQKQYIGIVDGLAGQDSTEETTSATPSQSSGKYQNIEVTVEDGLCKIVLNRPQKYNAITQEMYNEWAQAIDEAGNNDKVSLVALTGAGKFYCSGNDLSNFMDISPAQMPKMAEDGGILLRKFVDSFINCQKPIVAVINGPAVGISVTTLGLCDVVYASDAATFHTPFTALGQSAEGCSSYTFPKIMGNQKASELLMFNKKITATQACELGLVSEVFPSDSFQTEVWKRVKEMAKLPKNCLQANKVLIRQSEKETLHAVNKAECDVLVKQWQSVECVEAIMKFFSEKSKL